MGSIILYMAQIMEIKGKDVIIIALVTNYTNKKVEKTKNSEFDGLGRYSDIRDAGTE